MGHGGPLQALSEWPTGLIRRAEGSHEFQDFVTDSWVLPQPMGHTLRYIAQLNEHKCQKLDRRTH